MRSKYITFREVLTQAFSKPLRGKKKLSRSDFVWALSNISFEVSVGEVFGVIGPNGSGKSTLLKILSHILEPTTGYAEVRGRVSTLLELGTGFHPELSGRQNVYLNGILLGMKRAEIKQKFDAIVDFAEVHDFIDLPIKYYSSGMVMRLAFGVAVQLEPEILIIDEALAVGDIRFQKKCLERMRELANGGHTIVNVSHDMSAISSSADRCLFLNQGTIQALGPPSEVINQYQSFLFDPNQSKEKLKIAANSTRDPVHDISN